MGMASGYSGIQAGDMFFMARNSWQEFKKIEKQAWIDESFAGTWLSIP